MIKSLLDYQSKEKEKLVLLASVDGGRVKRELDTASKSLLDAKNALLSLDNDAKMLTGSYENAQKQLSEIFDRIEQFKKQLEKQQSEDEAASAVSYVSALLQKVTGYEGQLDDILRKIAGKTAAFEEAKMQVVKAQKSIAVLQVEYDKQRKQIEPSLAKFDAELSKLEKSVEPRLLEKYKTKRRLDKTGKATDIVVPLEHNRCGGCRFELPLNLSHKLATDGYIICEECGKIIYKN